MFSSPHAAASSTASSTAATAASAFTQRELRTELERRAAEPAFSSRDVVEVATLNEQSALNRVKLLELNPPRMLPQGNVGTPNALLNRLIAACKISPAELQRHGLLLSEVFRVRKSTLGFDFCCVSCSEVVRFQFLVLTFLFLSSKMKRRFRLIIRNREGDNRDCLWPNKAVLRNRARPMKRNQ